MTEPARQTPGELLKQRGELADDVIAARSNGQIVDLLTPVDSDAKLEPIRATDPDGLAVIRHSRKRGPGWRTLTRTGPLAARLARGAARSHA